MQGARPCVRRNPRSVAAVESSCPSEHCRVGQVTLIASCQHCAAFHWRKHIDNTRRTALVRSRGAPVCVFSRIHPMPDRLAAQRTFDVLRGASGGIG